MHDDCQNPFQQLYKTPLTTDELKEAEGNLHGFFALLLEIDQELKHENK